MNKETNSPFEADPWKEQFTSETFKQFIEKLVKQFKLDIAAMEEKIHVDTKHLEIMKEDIRTNKNHLESVKEVLRALESLKSYNSPGVKLTDKFLDELKESGFTGGVVTIVPSTNSGES